MALPHLVHWHIWNILVTPYDVVGAQATRWLASVFILYNNNLADFITFFTFCTIPNWLIFTFLRRNWNDQTSCLPILPLTISCLELPHPLLVQNLWLFTQYHNHIYHHVAKTWPFHVLKLSTYIPTHTVRMTINGRLLIAYTRWDKQVPAQWLT